MDIRFLERKPSLLMQKILNECNAKKSIIMGHCQNQYVDDIIKYIREAERKGIQSWHISSFLDWQFYHD